jgi:hypothetical protein
MAEKVRSVARGARPADPGMVATLPVLLGLEPHSIGQVFVMTPPERAEEAVILRPS